LEYPQYLHDAYAELPFCPTRKISGRISFSQHVIRHVTLFIIETYDNAYDMDCD